MKSLKELQFEDLTIKQKLGMAMIAHCGRDDCDVDYIEELVRERAVGAVWVMPKNGEYDWVIKRLLEIADYPLLVFTDAENGFDPYLIGRQNTIGMANSEELAYHFGLVVGKAARARGYNVVCNPMLDLVRVNSTCGSVVRSLGSDKERVAALAAAEARGMHDAGVLTIGKHFPGMAKTSERIDSHMGEAISFETKEELLDYNLYPYVKLIEQGLLDGVMMGHNRFVNVDPEYPMSLSPKGIDILRELGFDGLALTDALCMMGVVAKYGYKNSVGLAVGGGADLALPFINCNRQAMDWLCACYEEGMINEDRLNDAVKRVLAAQHKLTLMPKAEPVTKKEAALFARLNTDSVFAKTDDGVTPSLDKNGKYCFAILTEHEADLASGENGVDTMKNRWYHPDRIADYLKANFPCSMIKTIGEYPTADRIEKFLRESLGYEVVFITFFNSQCYIGSECLTSRVISLMEAMQASDRISTVVHFGNPFVLEDVPHVSRVIVGTISADGVVAALEVLTGTREAKGCLTYDVKLR